MATIRLLLDGTPADLPADIRNSLRLNSPSADVSLLDVRAADRVYQFTLPPTRTNDTLFRAARAHLTPGKFARAVEMTAALDCDGVQLLQPGAVCRLTQAGGSGYEVNLLSPARSLFELMGQRTLREITSFPDLPFAGYDDLADIIANDDRKAFDFSGVFVAYGNPYGTDDARALEVFDTPLELDDFLLPVYWLNVIERLFEDYGYQVEGAPLQDADWQNAIIPFTGPGEPPWNWGTLADFVLTLSFEAVSVPNTLTGDVCNLMLFDDDGDLDPFYDPGFTYVGYNLMARYHMPTTGTLRIQGSWVYDNATAYDRSNPAQEFVFPRIGIREPGTGTDTIVVLPGSSSSVGTTHTFVFDYEIEVPQGSGVSFARWLDAGDYSAWTFVFNGSIPSAPVDLKPALWLPELTQREFLRALLTLWSADIEVDNDRMVVRLIYRGEPTAAEAENATPLDDYTDPARLTFRPANRYQTLAFSFAADSADEVLTPGTYDRAVTMNGVGLNETKAVTVPFAATALRTFYRDDAGDLLPLSLPCMATLGELKTLPSEIVWTFDHTPRVLVAGDIDGNGLLMNGRAPTVVYHRQAAQTPIVWTGASGIIADRYAATLETLQYGDRATASARMTPSLYRELSRLGWAKLGGLLYRVQQVTGYQPAKDAPATVELLRYVPTSGKRTY